MSRPRNHHYPEELRRFSKVTLHAVRKLFNLKDPMDITEVMIVNAGRIHGVKIEYTDQYKVGLSNGR